jgi:hypothetical protein
MVDFVKKGKWTAEFVVYFIILFVMVYLGVQVIKSVLGFDVFFKWWNANGGNAYKQGFDMLSFALFQESRLAFNIRQLFIPGQDRLNYTDIMLIQSIAFNQARIDIDRKTDPPQGNFVLPHHVCQGIAWSSADDPVFQKLYNYWLFQASAASDLTYADPTHASGWNWPTIYQNNQIGPEDPSWSNISTNTAGGFWPHQNGCTGFFDMPGGGDSGEIPYNLLTNPARSSIGEAASLKAGKAPKYKDKNYSQPSGSTPLQNDLYLYGDQASGRSDKSQQVILYYIPGSRTARGSWAQLFADFGIIYTMSSLAGDSKVPVISDGALCGGSDNSTPLNPCPNACDYLANPNKDGSQISCGNDAKQAKIPSMTGMPISDFGLWYGGSAWISGLNVYGPNFFSAFRLDPQSYVFTSWVGNLYDDPTTGILLDPQAIKNLVGMGEAAIRGQNGGWIRFFKGINTDLRSYDEIMNQLFTTYATNFTARARITNTPKKKCGWADWLSVGSSVVGVGMMAMFIPPPIGLMAGAALLGGALVSGTSTAASKGCIPGIKAS